MRSATDVLEAMVTMFDSGDPTGAGDIVAADYVDRQGLGGEQLVGLDGFVHVVRTNHAAHREQTVTIEDLFGADDRAVARLRWRGVRIDGTEVDRQSIEIVRAADGKAVEHWGARC
ncbi:MAG: ester cyclase [Actinomycetota bacterium]